PFPPDCAICRIVGSNQNGVAHCLEPVLPNVWRTAVRTTLCLSLVSLLLMFAPSTTAQPPPRTVAEKSDYKATSRHADVVAFCEELAKQSKVVKLDTLGTSREGRTLPLLVLADPLVASPGQAGKRTVVLIVANIHAGEVDGKEAVLALARGLALGPERELLKHLVVLIVPNFNADGN